jgi:hypothetical protein
VIARPTRVGRHSAIEAQLSQVEFLDEGIDYADRITLFDPVVQSLQEQQALRACLTLNKSANRPPLKVPMPLLSALDVAGCFHTASANSGH